jgi:outer membrane protein assembly factor BamB
MLGGNTSPKREQVKPTLSRFGYLAIILLVAILVFSFVSAELSFSGRPSVDMLYLLAVTNLAVYLWIRIASGWNSRTHTKVVVVLVILQVVLFATVQMEGIRGNGRPVFAWRWAPLPADDFNAPLTTNARTADIDAETTSRWPQFRGPKRNGISEKNILNWKDSPPKRLWKQPIGSGWSSFAIVGPWCFTQEQRASEECLVCYEKETGKQIWCNTGQERFSEITGGEGPRATPTYDSGYLYALGATGVLKCVDAKDGTTKWETDILIDHAAENCYFGMCASPLVVDNKVIVSPGGKGSSLVAYDKTNGELIWKDGDGDASYSSPVAMTISGVDQILIFNGDGLFAHDMATGTVLWHIDWISNEEEKNNVCQPIQIGDSDVFISSGYGMGSARFNIEHRDSEWTVKTVWENQNLKSKFSSAVLHRDHIYGLDLGIMVCLDAKTGDRKWKDGRYAHGQFIKAGDFFIVQSERGYLAQVLVSPSHFEETARVKGLDHRTWTHPAIADGILLIRNDREMAAYQLEN